MKELKRTEYNHMKATVVASRDQLCIHPEIMDASNTDKILKCEHFVKENKCKFYNNITLKQLEPDLQKTIMDIEDLRDAGIKHECCPYYVAKEKARHIQIYFMPYNVCISLD